MEKKTPKPHAIMFPYPYQGHVNPFVHLAMKLASEGFTITFVNTLSVHHQITKSRPEMAGDSIFTEACKSGLDIRYKTVNDGFPLLFDRSLNHDQFVEGLIHVFSAHVDDLVGRMVHSDPPITCLIADTFFIWSSVIAKKYNLVYVSFWTEPALVLTLYYHLDLLVKNCHFASQDNREDTIDYIPGVRAIEPKDLMSYLRATDDISTVVHRVIYKAFKDVKRADFIVCNTVQELESETISALQEKQSIYAIGPVFPTGFTKNIVPTSLWSESDCTPWLHTKPHGSVLYVSFGSYAHVSRQDIVEIAYGLLLSGVNFIWVLRPDVVKSDETDFLPVGFEDKIKGKGLIVPWCSQIDVISNPTIGGFLSHCGWNSILESIWCSVPLLCFPLLTDQFTNRKLVVDEWRIGINLCEEKLITRDVVAERIGHVMSGNLAEGLRTNIQELKKILENTLTTHGSSRQNFNRFINDVEAKIREKACVCHTETGPYDTEKLPNLNGVNRPSN
ncbi:UDP-glycosyltransferase 86A1 [Morella rubra]|uniref:Glycosyltransferase n=1 Tax=Morella rubra TaxID=262757 RepID=A0A6A1WII4_9ROSI|nr:UDP-glycosyltransferase 86A1 [Morella rubra]KAB1223695.1 UDP-glycosyltransferase 86A1 [Morella rubra]